MRYCKIQWIDSKGIPTPDTNVAVGTTWMIERTYHTSDGRTLFFSESKRFPICLDHLQQLQEPHMAKNWRFEAFPEAIVQALDACKEVVGAAYHTAFHRLGVLFPGELRETAQWRQVATTIGLCLGVLIELQKTKEHLAIQER